MIESYRDAPFRYITLRCCMAFRHFIAATPAIRRTTRHKSHNVRDTEGNRQHVPNLFGPRFMSSAIFYIVSQYSHNGHAIIYNVYDANNDRRE